MSIFCTASTFDLVLIGSTLDAATIKLLNQKIQLSESIIKGRLSKRYDFTSYDTSTAVAPQLRSLCEQLTEGFYYKSMSRGNEKAFKRGESMCKMALEEIAMLQNGEAFLLNTAGSVVTQKEDGAWDMTSSTIDFHSTFNEDSPTNWAVDPDKLSNISNERD